MTETAEGLANLVEGGPELTLVSKSLLSATVSKLREQEAEIRVLRDAWATIAIAREHDVQLLHAGLSRRDWHMTERAANILRDCIDEKLRVVRRDALEPNNG